MADTYLPGTHCAVCVQLGRQVDATATVMADGRDYQACDEHAEWITIGGFRAAVLRATFHPTTKGAV